MGDAWKKTGKTESDVLVDEIVAAVEEKVARLAAETPIYG